jgi:hypothetical protein
MQSPLPIPARKGSSQKARRNADIFAMIRNCMAGGYEASDKRAENSRNFPRWET